MSKPSKSQLLYEANIKLQRAYAEITELEQRLADITSYRCETCGARFKPGSGVCYKENRD